MPKLVVNPDTQHAWEIELKPGANSFGRAPENDFPIEHASVSSAHCRIDVRDSGVVIKDLGSINGTFVGNMLVEEAALLPGQTFRLGDVVMRFESFATDSPPLAPPLSAKPHTQPASNGSCRSHPKAVADHYCAKCGDVFCELCVNTRMVSGAPTKFCKACGGECVSLRPEEIHEAPVFKKLIGGAFTYPFKHDGLIILIVGTIFYTAMNFLASHAMFFGIIIMVFGTGYLFSYMQRILTASAMGENRMPDWPDFSDWSDVIGPLLQVIGTILFVFGPAILIRVFAPIDAPWRDWALPASILLGCVYFPMAFTAVAMFDTIGAVNPLLIVPSILKIFGAYLLVVFLLVVVFVAVGIGGDYLEQIIRIPVLPGLISEFLGLYLLTVEMRILGLLYWTKKEELGWFPHSLR